MPCDVGEVPMMLVKQRKGCTMSCDEGKAAKGLQNDLRHSSFFNLSAALPTSQLILQPFRCFTYVIGTSPTSQLILQPFRRFTYVTSHSTALLFLHLRYRHFTYVTAHSPTLPKLHVRQIILQPFRCFTYVQGTSRTSLGEPPMDRGMKKQSVLD